MLTTTDGERWAIDPWLVGVEIDCLPSFNAASLTLPRASPALLGKELTAILITQPFSDHCHEETLVALGGSCPIYCVPAAARRLGGGPLSLRGRVRPLSAVPKNHPGWTALHIIPPLLAPTHGGVLLSTPTNGTVLIAPHGLEPSTLASLVSTLAAKASTTRPLPRPLTILSTTSTFELPWWLGGTVNLGLSRAAELCNALKADVFHPTHDENKAATGCVVGVARRRYCRGPSEIAAAIPAYVQAGWYGGVGIGGGGDGGVEVAGGEVKKEDKEEGSLPHSFIPSTLPPTCASPTHYPPPPQLSLEEGLREACHTSLTLRTMAQTLMAKGEGRGKGGLWEEGVRVHRSWCPSVTTYTYHSHISVPLQGLSSSSSTQLLNRISELFLRAYELDRHGWYAQFVEGVVTQPVTTTAPPLTSSSISSGGDCQWCESGHGESTSGWGVFDLGLGTPRAYHTLFTRRRFEGEGGGSNGGQGHAIVLRSVTPPPSHPTPPKGAVHVFLLPPTGDYFVVEGGALHWHHICTVAGVKLLPGGLDRAFMNTLRGCGGDGQERGTYLREGQGFVGYIKALLKEEATP